ncbi:MAG: hypothetical protein ACI9MR_000051 [Myxococcota bacterium]|jgi:hypothetical protein
MRVGVALVRADHTWERMAEADRRALLDACDVISIRVQGAPSLRWDALADAAKTEGVELRIHAWVGSYHDRGPLKRGSSAMTLGSADREGRELATQAAYYGASRAEPNVEAGLFRGPRQRALGRYQVNPAWRDLLRWYSQGYNDPPKTSAQLGWVGYADPAWHYPGARMSAADRKRFDASTISVMAYGRTVDAVRRQVRRAAFAWPGRSLCLWISPPRLDRIGRRVGDPAAVIEMVRREFSFIVTEILIYIGEDQSRKPTSPRNPLTSLISSIKGEPSALATLQTVADKRQAS